MDSKTESVDLIFIAINEARSSNIPFYVDILHGIAFINSIEICFLFRTSHIQVGNHLWTSLDITTPEIVYGSYNESGECMLLSLLLICCCCCCCGLIVVVAVVVVVKRSRSHREIDHVYLQIQNTVRANLTSTSLSLTLPKAFVRNTFRT